MADDSAKKTTDSGDATTEKSANGEKKALSIVALIFGILGIVFCWSGFFALACCLVGLICGIIALVKKHQKGMAVAGLVCGAVGLIPAILFSFIWGGIATMFSGGIVDACKDDPSCNVTINGQTVTNNQTDKPVDKPVETPTSTKDYSTVVNDIYDALVEDDDDAKALPENDLKDVISDLITCLDKAGVKIKSIDDLDMLEDEDGEENEEAEECGDDFEEDIYKLYLDNIDLGE